MDLTINMAETCDHNPSKWSIKAVPSKAGHGFIVAIPTITCACGTVANITDARGHRSPATSIGVDFLSAAPIDRQTPQTTQPTPKPTDRPAPEPIGEGPGTELSTELERLGMSSCAACKGLARLMNGWGPQGCRERMDEIIADVLPRARAWFDHATVREKLSVWWNSDQRLTSALAIGQKAGTWELDEALKAVIRVQVNAAIDRWEAKAVAQS